MHNKPKMIIFILLFVSFTLALDCENDEVDLGWGNCNDIVFDSSDTDGCMLSGCFSIKETTRLNFSYITLGVFPINIGELINLTELHLSDCGITGSIPTNIKNLDQLVFFGVYDNDLGLSDSLGINSNLTGQIPIEIGSLEALSSLRLENNNLVGNIPNELGDLTNLTQLILSGNQLEGEFPISITSMISLETLSIRGNKLTGEIPNEIGNLINLTVLDLGYNNFSGYIPNQISDLKSLYLLSFSNNNLLGEIPIEIAGMDLFYCTLNDNELTGDIPEQFCDFYLIDLSNNFFCSPYPDCLTADEIGFQETQICLDCTLGDVNGDSMVNVLDIVSLINKIVDGNYNECSDINLDGKLNILDAVILVNLILEP